MGNNTYQYHSNTNQIHSVALKGGGSATFTYDARGNQTHRNGQQEVWYNAFNKPTKITKNHQDITLVYGPDIMRYKQTRVVENPQGVKETIHTWYVGKHFEVEDNQTSGTVNTRYFISDVAIVDVYNNRDPQIAFTHKDRLGSTVTMTDQHNNLTSMRHFDPFGKPRGGDWALLQPPQFPTNIADNRTDIRRGFTDHEHLDEAELIHMNGRVYDYNVGRFMSVDPFIQSPSNSQSINPYSYIMNNPMAGTDPTGYCAAGTGSNMRDCGDMMVDVVITMTDGTVYNLSVVVQDVNFANGMDVNQGMLSGTMTAVSQSIADRKSEASKAQSSSTVTNTNSRNNTKPKTNSSINTTTSTNNYDPRADKDASFSDKLSLAWDMFLNGDIIDEAVERADDDYFGGSPIASSLGISDTLKEAVNMVDAASNGEVEEFINSAVNVAANQIQVMRVPSIINGNSRRSKKEHHVYAIVDLNDLSVYKYGISGAKLNKNGSSRRANAQANKLNKAAGFERYRPVVIRTGIKGRARALLYEKAYVYGYAEKYGSKPIGNIRP